MKALKRRRDLFAALLSAGVLFAGWFRVRNIPEAAAIFGIVSTGCLFLLVWQSHRLYEARLVWDNRILVVPSAVGSIAGKDNAQDEPYAVISTFGVLMGKKIYKWGYDSVRLRSIEIRKEKIRLVFGDENDTKCIELLHGMADIRMVAEVRHKLWRETGVLAQLSGW